MASILTTADLSTPSVDPAGQAATTTALAATPLTTSVKPATLPGPQPTANTLKTLFYLFDGEQLKEDEMKKEISRINNKLVQLYDSYYPAVSNASLNTIKSGKLQRGDNEIVIKQNVIDFTVKMSEMLNLDHTVAYDLISQCGLTQVTGDLTKYTTSVFTEYYQERLYLMEILGSLIRKSAIETSKYKDIISEFLKTNEKDMETKLLRSLVSFSSSTMPSLLPSGHLVAIYRSYMVREQVAVSETLFSLVYCRTEYQKNEEFTTQMIKYLIDKRFGEYSSDLSSDTERVRLVTQCEFNLVFTLLLLMREKWGQAKCKNILDLLCQDAAKRICRTSAFFRFITVISVLKMCSCNYIDERYDQLSSSLIDPSSYVYRMLEFQFAKTNPLIYGYYEALDLFFRRLFELNRDAESLLPWVDIYCSFLERADPQFSLDFWKSRGSISLYLAFSENLNPEVLIRIIKSISLGSSTEFGLIANDILQELLDKLILDSSHSVQFDMSQLHPSQYIPNLRGFIFNLSLTHVCYKGQYKIATPKNGYLLIESNLMDYMFSTLLESTQNIDSLLSSNDAMSLLKSITILFSKLIEYSGPETAAYLQNLFNDNNIFDQLLNCYYSCAIKINESILNPSSYHFSLISSILSIFSAFSKHVPLFIIEIIVAKGFWSPDELISAQRRGSFTNIYEIEKTILLKLQNNIINGRVYLQPKPKLQQSQIQPYPEQRESLALFENTKVLNQLFLNIVRKLAYKADTATLIHSFLQFQHQIFSDFTLLEPIYLRDIVSTMIKGFNEILSKRETPENFILSILEQFLVQSIEVLFKLIINDNDKEMTDQFLEFVRLSLKSLLVPKPSNPIAVKNIISIFFYNNNSGINLYQLIYQKLSNNTSEADQIKYLKVLILVNGHIYTCKEYQQSFSFLSESTIIQSLETRAKNLYLDILKLRFLVNLLQLKQYELFNRIFTYEKNKSFIDRWLQSLSSTEDNKLSTEEFILLAEIFSNLSFINQSFSTLLFDSKPLWTKLISIHSPPTSPDSNPISNTLLKKISSFNILAIVLLHQLPPSESHLKKDDIVWIKSTDQQHRENFKLLPKREEIPESKTKIFKFNYKSIRVGSKDDKPKAVNQYYRSLLAKSYSRFYNLYLIRNNSQIKADHLQRSIAVLTDIIEDKLKRGKEFDMIQLEKFTKNVISVCSTSTYYLQINNSAVFNDITRKLLLIFNFFFRDDVHFNKTVSEIFHSVISALMYNFEEVEQKISITSELFNQAVYPIGLLLENVSGQYELALINRAKILLQCLISHIATKVLLSSCSLPDSCLNGLLKHFEASYAKREISSIKVTLNLLISFSEQPLLLDSLLSRGVLQLLAQCLATSPEINYFDPYIEDNGALSANPWFNIFTLIIDFVSSCKYAFESRDHFQLDLTVFILTCKDRLLYPTYRFVECNGMLDDKESLNLIESILRLFSYYTVFTRKYYSDQRPLFDDILSHIYRVLVVIVCQFSNKESIEKHYPPQTKSDQIDDKTLVRDGISLYIYQIERSLVAMVQYSLSIIYNTFPFIKENPEFTPLTQFYSNIATLSTFNKISYFLYSKHQICSEQLDQKAKSLINEKGSRFISQKLLLQSIEKSCLLIYNFINYNKVTAYNSILDDIHALRKYFNQSKSVSTSSPNIKSVNLKSSPDTQESHDLLFMILSNLGYEKK